MKTFKFWKEEEIIFLKENYKKLNKKEIANLLGRTYLSILNKGKELNLREERLNSKNKKFKPWTEEEKNFLKENYNFLTKKEIGNFLGRSKLAVNAMGIKLFLQKKIEHGKPITLKNINGVVKTWKNRKECSKETGISVTTFSCFIKSETTINGWYFPQKTKNSFFVYDENDNKFWVDNCIEFSIQNNLNLSCVKKLSKGTIKYHKNFRLPEAPKKQKVVFYQLKSPNG